MYDFHDDAGHHHGSQCKHWTAFKRQAPSLASALLGTFRNFRHFTFWLYLWHIYAEIMGNFTLLDLGLNLLKARNNKLDKCLI